MTRILVADDNDDSREAALQRLSETQAAILNALSTHVALLDDQGVIVSVNDAWRRFAESGQLQGPAFFVGQNYLEVCERATGDDADFAQMAAAGIRRVLQGESEQFVIEYPCHSPPLKRWFRMLVVSLQKTRTTGAVVMHVDITESRQAAEKLMESEANVAAAQALAHLGSWKLDLTSMTGTSSAENSRLHYRDPALGAPSFEEFIELVHPDDRPAFEQARTLIPAIREPYALEYRTHPALGPVRHLSTIIQVIRDAGGNPACATGTALDVTERKQAEYAITHALQRLNEAQRVGRIGDWEWDMGTETITWSPQVFEIVGRDPGLGPPRDYEDNATLHDEASRSLQLEKVAQAISSGEIQEYELVVVRPDGQRRHVQTRAVPRKDASGKVVGLYGTIQDISARVRAETALLESRQMLRQVLDTIPVRVFWKDADSVFLGSNRSFARDAGLSSPEELVGRNDRDMAWAAQAENYRADDLLVMATGTSKLNYEEPQTAPDGRVIWLRTSKIPLLDREGRTQGVLGTYEDITEHKLAEEALRASEIRVQRLNRVYAVLSQINALLIRVQRRDDLFSDACRIAVEAGGFHLSLIGVMDKRTMKIVPAASAGDEEALMSASGDVLSLREGGLASMVAQAVGKKTAIVSNDLQSDPRFAFGQGHAEFGVRSVAILPLIVADEVAGVFALFARETQFFHTQEMTLLTELVNDIAFALDHIDKQERLEYLAYYDALTGLANQHLFRDRLTQHMRGVVSGGHRLALFLLDLQRFKLINDSIGRPAGDALLRQVGEWLGQNMGGIDLVARVDADHFAVVLPEVKPEGHLTGLLENRIEAFRKHPFRVNDVVLRLAVTVGGALFPDDGANADTLFKHAEAALKKAKASGDQYLLYTQKMTDAVAGRLTLETRLRQALDKGEFVLHYQPKMNLQDGRLTGAEALIRWNDPGTGLVLPGDFIPVLEETGLIHDVGRWALRQAVEDSLRWRAANQGALRIAVNVSPMQLRHRGFVDTIRQAIGIDARAATGLELEITESLVMEDIKLSIASLRAIRDMGVRIAIDDFGTGYSSLSYLSRLPVDTLKIDRSFVVDMTEGPEGLALVSAIIALAKSLKLAVVAEGVETDEQSRQLRLLGCDEMQGFLVSKGVPADIFEARYLRPQAPAAFELDKNWPALAIQQKCDCDEGPPPLA